MSRFFIALFVLSIHITVLHAQSLCGIVEFKKLTSISVKDSISDIEFDTAVKLLKKLEYEKCSDYDGVKNGVEYVKASRTFLFGKICAKKNDDKAVKEYIQYMKRQHGSAEEEISFSFEKIFVKQPGYVLSTIGFDKVLLNQLVWGFLNNHYGTLTHKNYKIKFYQINPKVRVIYPQYKKQLDYLLNEISEELKG